jgi:dihydroorotase-like cyclic amidohydrolase
MAVDLVIRNARVVAPAGVFRGGVAVAGETIVAVASDAALPQARRVLDAREQFLLPGLIDAHVHMASEEDASIEEGLRLNMPVETDGALHGGVTTLGHFVGQRNEPLVPNVERTSREGNRWSRVDFFLHAIVSAEGHFAEQPAVWERGVTSAPTTAPAGARARRSRAAARATTTSGPRARATAAGWSTSCRS